MSLRAESGPVMALSVIRGAATFLVAIGVRADIGQRKRWIARSRMTLSGHPTIDGRSWCVVTMAPGGLDRSQSLD